MMEDTATRAVEVPGRFERAFDGIVVRDGRYYWSAWGQFARYVITAFVLSLLGKLVLLRDMWRGYPEWMGVPGLTAPAVGSAALFALMLSAGLVLSSGRERQRFNAASPPVPGTIKGSGRAPDVASR